MKDFAYCILAERALLRFEGADARAFLHGQLTCDVNALAADNSTYGAYCTPKGRVLTTFLLWSSPEGFFMQLPQVLREAVQKRLSMYVLRSKVRVSDATADYVQYAIAGEAAAAAAQRLANVVGTSIVKPAANRCLAAVPRANAAAALKMLADAGTAMTETWWRALDIEAGIATVLPETQEQFVPQMLNLDAIGGVSFNKGCYPGQEIVARMHYLGRLKERMVRARVASPQPPRPGDKVYGTDLGTQAAGMVVDAVPASDGTCELLAVVHSSSVSAGPVHLGAADGPQLTLEELPYALPAR